jgi:superoxide reductase
MGSVRGEVYKCERCGQIIEVIDGAVPPLHCCGIPMVKAEEQTADQTVEKHVPIIEATDQGVKVTVGSTPHPMTEDHYIEWIEVINGDYVNRKYLKPGDEPVAEFYVPLQDGLIVREYCNTHGLWKA